MVLEWYYNSITMVLQSYYFDISLLLEVCIWNLGRKTKKKSALAGALLCVLEE